MIKYIIKTKKMNLSCLWVVIMIILIFYCMDLDRCCMDFDRSYITVHYRKSKSKNNQSTITPKVEGGWKKYFRIWKILLLSFRNTYNLIFWKMWLRSLLFYTPQLIPAFDQTGWHSRWQSRWHCIPKPMVSLC